MKFFTVEYYEAEDRSRFGNRLQQYEQYIESLCEALPASVMELARMHVEFHDALIAQVRRDDKARTLTVVLRCGHLQVGYYDMELHYSNAEISDAHWHQLRFAARSTRESRRYIRRSWAHEVDTTDEGRIAHRLLLDWWGGRGNYPTVWVEIVCTELQWQRIPRPNRELPPWRERLTHIRV